jgi:hypothetical protein
MSRHGIPEDVADCLGITNITEITDDPTELPAPDVFQTGAATRPCEILVEEAAAAIGCPPNFVALPMLVVLGSAIGNAECSSSRPAGRRVRLSTAR